MAGSVPCTSLMLALVIIRGGHGERSTASTSARWWELKEDGLAPLRPLRRCPAGTAAAP